MMIGETPESYSSLTVGSDNVTMTPNLFSNSLQGLLALPGDDSAFNSVIDDILKENSGKNRLFRESRSADVLTNLNNNYIENGTEFDAFVGQSGQDIIGGYLSGDSFSGGLDSTNNLPDGATDLGILIDTISTNNFVGDLDTNDFYGFSINSESEVRVDLTGLSADADLSLMVDYNSDGLIDYTEVLDGSYDTDSNPETIIRPLLPGNYILEVWQYQGDTNYNLDLSATPLPPLQPDNAGQMLTTAATLGTINGTFTVNEFLDPLDNIDFYQIQLPTQSNLILNLNFLNPSANADGDIALVQDRNADGFIDYQSEMIVSSVQAGTLPETISLNGINPGEYFIVVDQVEGNTAYTLELSATPEFIPPQILQPSGIPNYSSYYGWGIVDAAQAVAAATGQTIPYPDIEYSYSKPFINSPTYDNLADLNALNVPEVWSQGYTGNGVIVAVLDSGVDVKHFDLAQNIWVNSEEANGLPGIDDDNNGYIDDVNGYDFVGQDANPNPSFSKDDSDHGTHVAGIVAAAANGETFGMDGFVNVNGVAFNAQIMPLRVFDSKEIDKTFAEGIVYAVNNGAKVINISGGQRSPDSQQQILSQPEIQQALEYAKQNNVTVVIAAGNERSSFAEGLVTLPIYPSRFSENNLAISVGAVDGTKGNTLEFADFSNPAGVQPSPFVVAPGVEVLSTVPGNTYNFFPGTSMAAPYVSGVIALMLEANPNLTVDQIQQILMETSNSQVITEVQSTTVV